MKTLSKEGEVFDKDETDRSTLTQVGWEIPGWKNYTNGKPCYYIGMNADIFSFNEIQSIILFFQG